MPVRTEVNAGQRSWVTAYCLLPRGTKSVQTQQQEHSFAPRGWSPTARNRIRAALLKRRHGELLVFTASNTQGARNGEVQVALVSQPHNISCLRPHASNT